MAQEETFSKLAQWVVNFLSLIVHLLPLFYPLFTFIYVRGSNLDTYLLSICIYNTDFRSIEYGLDYRMWMWMKDEVSSKNFYQW